MHIREINMFFKRGSKFLKTVAAVRTKCPRTILGVTDTKNKWQSGVTFWKEKKTDTSR